MRALCIIFNFVCQHWHNSIRMLVLALKGLLLQNALYHQLNIANGCSLPMLAIIKIESANNSMRSDQFMMAEKCSLAHQSEMSAVLVAFLIALHSNECDFVLYLYTLLSRRWQNYGKHLNLLPIRPHRMHSMQTKHSVDKCNRLQHKHYMSTIFTVETCIAVEIKLVAFSQ